jgi:hypothetical protein
MKGIEAHFTGKLAGQGDTDAAPESDESDT